MPLRESPHFQAQPPLPRAFNRPGYGSILLFVIISGKTRRAMDLFTRRVKSCVYPGVASDREAKTAFMRTDSEHPDFDALFHYSEGHLSESDRKDLEAHLRTCVRCRGILDSLTATAPAVPPLSEFLTKLSELQRKLQREGATPEVLRSRVASELVPYLGAAAANRILQRVAPGGENLLPTIDSALRLFLGKAAADRVVNHIVDRAIMRT